MAVFDWLRANPAYSSPRGSFAGRESVAPKAAPVLHLPPDDVPTDEVSTFDTCWTCPATPVMVLMRVLMFVPDGWTRHQAATVHSRPACRHHADELLAEADSPWFEGLRV